MLFNYLAVMKYLITFLTAVIFLVGCSDNKQQEFIDSTKNFSVQAPLSLKREKGLNDEAQLQIADKERELYLIGLAENKAEIETTFLETGLITQNNTDNIYNVFSETALKMLLNTVIIDEPEKIKLLNLEINGLPAKQSSFVANVNGLDVYYIFTTIEGTKYYYQLLTWTLEELKDNSDIEMKNIILSFKEN